MLYAGVPALVAVTGVSETQFVVETAFVAYVVVLVDDLADYVTSAVSAFDTFANHRMTE